MKSLISIGKFKKKALNLYRIKFSLLHEIFNESILEVLSSQSTNALHSLKQSKIFFSFEKRKFTSWF